MYTFLNMYKISVSSIMFQNSNHAASQSIRFQNIFHVEYVTLFVYIFCIEERMFQYIVILSADVRPSPNLIPHDMHQEFVCCALEIPLYNWLSFSSFCKFISFTLVCSSLAFQSAFVPSQDLLQKFRNFFHLHFEYKCRHFNIQSTFLLAICSMA